jgi:hypothetical protein
MLMMKVATALTAGGQVVQEFGEFVHIKSALVAICNKFTTSTLLATSWSISGNVLTVTVEKNVYSGSWSDWEPATTGDVVYIAMLVDAE